MVATLKTGLRMWKEGKVCWQVQLGMIQDKIIVNKMGIYIST